MELKKKMVRKEIMEFAEEIERVMTIHDTKKGDSWKTLSIGFLEEKMEEEWDEWFSNPCKEEAVDIGAMSMMLWNRYKQEG